MLCAGWLCLDLFGLDQKAKDIEAKDDIKLTHCSNRRQDDSMINSLECVKLLYLWAIHPCVYTQYKYTHTQSETHAVCALPERADWLKVNK